MDSVQPEIQPNKLYLKNNNNNRFLDGSDIIPPYLPSLKLQLTVFADKSLALSPTSSSGIVSDINDTDNQVRKFFL